MAKTNTAERVRNTRNPFKGMTLAEMKKKYSSMSASERAANVQTFRDAAKNAPKSKPATKKTTKSEAAKRFYSSSSKGSVQKNLDKAKSNFFRSSSGTRGQLRPNNPASPTVRRKGSTTGASVDPRERSLRKNRKDAKRSRRQGLKMNRRGRRVR